MNRLTSIGAERLFGAGDWGSLNGRAMLIDLSVSDTHVKAITGVSTATPAVVTVGSTAGWQNGDLVALYDVGGTQNVNQTFRIKNVINGTTFSLQTLEDGLDVVGTGSYTSGGTVINLTQIGYMEDMSAGRVGTDATVSNKAEIRGTLSCDPISFAAFSGSFDAMVIYELDNNDSDSVPLIWIDGRLKVTLAAAASTSDTTLAVQRLSAPLPSGTVLRFSNGVAATLSAAANAGARTLAVTAIAGGIAAGHEAEAYKTNPGFPGSSSGSSFSLTFDNNEILTLI